MIVTKYSVTIYSVTIKAPYKTILFDNSISLALFLFPITDRLSVV